MEREEQRASYVAINAMLQTILDWMFKMDKEVHLLASAMKLHTS